MYVQTVWACGRAGNMFLRYVLEVVPLFCSSIQCTRVLDRTLMFKRVYARHRWWANAAAISLRTDDMRTGAVTSFFSTYIGTTEYVKLCPGLSGWMSWRIHALFVSCIWRKTFVKSSAKRSHVGPYQQCCTVLLHIYGWGEWDQYIMCDVRVQLYVFSWTHKITSCYYTCFKNHEKIVQNGLAFSRRVSCCNKNSRKFENIQLFFFLLKCSTILEKYAMGLKLLNLLTNSNHI